MRSLQIEGLKGNRLALQNYLKLAQEVFQREADEAFELYEAALDYKDNYLENIHRCKARGLPPLLPHTDDVVIDRTTGHVLITGPRDRQELQTLARLLEARDLIRNKIELQHQNIEECEREGYSPTPTELKILERFNDLLEQINGKFADRGWLPRLAGKEEDKTRRFVESKSSQKSHR